MEGERKNEDAESVLVCEESSWTHLPPELLLEIFSRLFAGDRVMFVSVCRSWSSMASEPHLGSMLEQDSSHPYLMLASERIFHPIYSEFYYELDCWNTLEHTIHAARDDWLLMRGDLRELYFYNPFTEAEVILPVMNGTPHSPYFSSPPTSKEWQVIAVITDEHNQTEIYSIRTGDEDWTLEKQLPDNTFTCSYCNAVVCNDMYYFLGTNAKLLSYDPKTQRHIIHEAPESISELISIEGKKYTSKREQYMLESDGNLLCVFVGYLGSPVHLYKWNVSTMAWETIENLENKMLFVSRPLSLLISATIAGTGNKIYFPRLLGKHGLFYSLTTRKYHTFEMGTTRQNYDGSKFPLYATWIRPEKFIAS